MTPEVADLQSSSSYEVFLRYYSPGMVIIGLKFCLPQDGHSLLFMSTAVSLAVKQPWVAIRTG